MASLFFLIDQIAIGIYAILVAIVLYFLREVLVARSEYRATQFELERDLARYHQINALTFVVLAIQLGIMVLGIQQVVVPYLENEDELQEQVAIGQEVQDGVFATPTPPPQSASGFDIEPVAPLDDDDTVLLLTPTLTPTPVGTIVPNPPAFEGCTDDRATLLIPANGMRVFQPITIVGTAYTDDFARAKLEISGPSTQNTYAVINDVLQPVPEAREFSQFAPANYESGVYQFRLTVFNIENTLVASCMVNIYLSEPPTTPTPTPQPTPN
jgi:hypothetical protein